MLLRGSSLTTLPEPPPLPPGLPQLYGYMLANRKKVLGGGAAKKAKVV
jgi:hypothetical protein